MTVSTTTLDNVIALNRDARPYSVLYRDVAMKNGLFLRVSHAGKQEWWVQSRNSLGKHFRHRIGEYPTMDLAVARRECERVCAAIAAGRRGAMDLPEQTLWQVFEKWGKRGSLSDSTLKKYEWILRKYANEWLDKPLHSLTHARLKELCDRIAENPGEASLAGRLIRIIRGLANYAKLPLNPAMGMNIPTSLTKSVGRSILSPAILRTLFDAIDTLNPYPRAYFYTLLFTGFRERSVRVMEWSHLKLEGGGAPACLISDSSASFGHGGAVEMPLHPYLAMELRTLRSHHAKHGFGSPYMYPLPSSRAGAAAATSSLPNPWRTEPFKRSLARLRELTGMQELRHCNFRETVASYSMDLFEQIWVTQGMLNQQTPSRKFGRRGMASTETLRPFVESYGDALLMLAGRLVERDMSPLQSEFWKTKVKLLSGVEDDFKRQDGRQTRLRSGAVSQVARPVLATDVSSDE
ncbi:Arm DNA-binding domain-containing protein [Burkholderia sp. JPY481]